MRHLKVIFIGNAGNDQSLGQLLLTGVVSNEISEAAERVASLNLDCVGTRRLARGGLEHWP